MSVHRIRTRARACLMRRHWCVRVYDFVLVFVLPCLQQKRNTQTKESCVRLCSVVPCVFSEYVRFPLSRNADWRHQACATPDTSSDSIFLTLSSRSAEIHCLGSPSDSVPLLLLPDIGSPPFVLLSTKARGQPFFGRTQDCPETYPGSHEAWLQAF